MNSDLPQTLAANPVLSTWITVRTDGTIELRVGKVELGQGVLTALTLIAANELGVDANSVVAASTNTENSPDEGLTAGSMSIAISGASVRRVCAEVRHLFVQTAALRERVDEGDIRVVSGNFLDRNDVHISSYAELAGQMNLDVEASDNKLTTQFQSDEHIEDLLRIDLPDKVLGRPRFIHDLVFEGMLHARISRPPQAGAHLVAVPIDEVKAMPGVREVIIEGDFIAVIATREGQADRAVTFLNANSSWNKSAMLPDQTELASWLRMQPVETNHIRAEGADHAPSATSTTLKATYSRPFIVHGSIAPSCAIAAFDGERLRIWSNSQGIFRLRFAIANALNLKEEHVVIQHVESAGSYGHNGADDAAFEAALLALKMPGSPIRVQWSRADELSWEPFGPAMTSDLEASLRGDGIVTDWSSQVWSNGHTSRPGYVDTNGFLSEAHRLSISELPAALDPPPSAGFGIARNAEPLYNFARMDISSHRLLAMPIRTSALRSLGAHHNVFAIESFMDELAAVAQQDPLAFRIAHLSDPRAIEVLLKATSLANWSGLREQNIGRGLAFARYKNRGAYCAVVAEVEAEEQLLVKRLTIAVDVGRVISADGVRNQIEGGAIQATSWALREQVRFDREAITSRDWESYPILSFSDVPFVDVHLISRPDEPSLGAGEATMGPVTAAIANAIFDALGVRLRSLPYTRENILAAIENQ